MMRYFDQKGFLLLDATILSILLLSMAALLFGLEQAARIEGQNEGRLTALYLLEAQMSFAEDLHYRQKLEPGTLPWQGDSGDLKINGGTFDVYAQVSREEGGLEVEVHARWSEFGKGKEITMKKVLLYHEEDL